MEHKLHNRILSALLALVLVLTGFPVAAFAEGENAAEPESTICAVCGAEPCICMPEAEGDTADAEAEVSADFAIFCDGLAVTALELCRSEKRTVTAENLPEGCTRQWQIYVPGASFWVNISGQTGESLDLSFALLGNLLDETDTALVRCAALCDGAVAETSGVLSVAIVDDPEEEEVPMEETPVEEAPAEEDPEIEPVDSVSEVVLGAVALADGAETVADEDVTYYTVTIEYVYSAKSKFVGQRVALPYIAEVVLGTICNATADSPNCVGYTPDVCSDTAVFDTDTFAIDLSKLGEITSNVSITVEYSPAEVSYTVRHYQQNVDDDEYTWVDTTMTTGYTEDQTNDSAAKTYTGFTALSHYREEIAADSSTMIDIYYDRNYYLMSFDLDGGYGVEAIYARYGADISVSVPKRAGYTFDEWSLDGITAVSLPDTMPAENRSYKALWTAGGATYTVAYWLENADTDDKYDFVGSVSATADAGSSVSGSDSAVANSIFTDAERQYYAYNSDKTDANITVAGNGSTVVNVYYDRNEYTLKFYYARLEGTTYDIANNTNNSSANGGTAASASWVGNFTIMPTLDSKYTEQSEVINGNTYYYFTITAKYGASLSDLWPNAPLTAAGNYNFISWGTHYGSGYYNANSNKNIKGVYSLMDSGLLIDAAVTADQGVNHWMVGYWNTDPTMYTYEIYYSILSGETADRTYNNVEYKKVAEYTVGSTDYPSGQTALSFDGVTSVGKDYDSNNKVDGAVVRFYYQRIEHTVTFDDSYGNTTAYTIPYGATISSYITTVPRPTYPDKLPTNAYEFGGWYQSKDGVGKLDTSITMPDEDLIYYAKWTPKVYTMTIEDGNGAVLSTQQVSYGSTATKPTDPTMEDATFIGWYYLDSHNVEQRFDFDNMTITANITIYAKWRSSVMKAVEIYYVVENGDGTTTQIADTETLMMRLSQTRTFEAKTGNSLYADYRTGCFPTTASHSITIADADTESDEPVTYTFVYKKYGSVPYQVEFYVQESDGSLRAAFRTDDDGKAVFVEYGQWDSTYTEYVEQHWQNDKAIVTELYVPDDLADASWKLPDAYLPNALKIQKIIVPSNTEGVDPEEDITANVIQFIYTYTEPASGGETEDTDDDVYESRYLVQHYVQNASDTTVYDLYSYSDETGLSGETTTASPISIPGYTYSYDVTNEKKQSGTTLGAGADATANTMDDILSGTITADDALELNFYYTVNSYPYQVMYLEQDTNRVLATTKTTDSDGKQLTGLYGSKVTEDAIAIDGYDIVGSSTKTIYIQMEAGATASVNTITFYYKLKSAELVISKKVELDAEQADQEGISEIPSWVYDQEFTFTIYQPDGFPKSVYHYTFTGTDGSTEEKTVNAGVQTIQISLKHGETVQFHDFPMGMYTVTETYVPGFKATVDNYIAQTHTVTLNADGQTETLAFVNYFPFYTGDLVIKKNVTKLDESDPTATEAYKVTVVLEPDDSAREVDRPITFVDQNGKSVTDANGNSSFTIPKLTGTDDQTEFTIELLVPVDGEVKLVGVPVCSFTATEEVKGTIGYIYDFYTVKYNKAVHENDEVTGTNHIVTGSIHGGHPTAVTFNNTYKKGDLTINKTVTQEYPNDNWNGDTFEFSISGTTELPDGTYTIKIDDSTETVTVENGKLSLTKQISVARTTDGDSWFASLTIENLPAGYYTVTEVENDKYSTTSVCDPDTGLVNDTDIPAKFYFTNIYKRTTGSLQVSKKIEIVGEGHSVDDTQEFEFTVELTDGTLVGPYSISGSSEELSVVDGKLTFKLKHGESIRIDGLPVGEYRVAEKQITGYASHFDDAATATENGTATVKTNETTVLGVTNKYPVNCGTLVVNKVVVTPDDRPSNVDQAPTGDQADTFAFTVLLSNYSELIDLDKFVAAQFSTGSSGTCSVDDKTKTITFTLKNGEFVELTLPVCNYTITETPSNDYTTASEYSDGANQHIASGEKETVTFTNTYKRHYADLKIIQSGMTSETDSGIYELVNSKDEVVVTVMITGNNKDNPLIVEHLPVDKYTLREIGSDWTWTYENTGDGTSHENPEVEVTVTDANEVIFAHTGKHIDWLHHEAALPPTAVSQLVSGDDDEEEET